MKAMIPYEKVLKPFAWRKLGICFIIGILSLFFTANAQTVTKQLYLSDPSQALDRVDPVATADASTATSLSLVTTQSTVSVANTSSGYSANPNSTTFSVSHTTGTGENRLMLVGISQKNKLVTSVTYGGVALTLVGEVISGGNARMHLYRLVNPASGTANVVVTLSANPDKGIVVNVVSFTGVNQTTPLGSFTGVMDNSNTASTTINSASGELVFDVATYRNATMTANASQTVLSNINSGGEIRGGGVSTKPGAGSVTMVWNGSASQDWALGVVAIKPAPANLTTTFTQSPALCSDLTIKSGTPITLTAYLNIVSGTMPANPNITAQLKYGATTILSFAAPVYNSGTGIITWSGTLGSDHTVPAGEAIALTVTTAQGAVNFRIEFDSQTKPSKINLPVSTYINVNSVNVYNAPYPGGIPIVTSLGGVTKYIRAVVSDPFGYSDITSLNFNITPGSSVAATSMATSGCTRTYEYAWPVPAIAGTYTIAAIAREGFENTVTDTNTTSIDVCINCPPSAVDDTASGPGGIPLTISVMANDSDPNNNLNTGSLSVVTEPSNGTVLISNGKLVYVPNGTFSGNDTIEYQICDFTNPTPICATAFVFVQINPIVFDPCQQASKTHTYFVPYPEQDVNTVLLASSSVGLPSNDVRTIISLKIPYPGMTIFWDEWEDGYETNIYNPLQSTTKVWGDGNIFNGIVPGYPTDIIPAGGSIVLDNTMAASPRNPAIIMYDGKDKILSTGQIAMTQVCGEPSLMSVQVMKTNITSTYDFGQSFTVPFGQDFYGRDFDYTALFIRAHQDSTVVNVDKDNNGSFDTTLLLNQGGSYLVNGGVLTGAVVTSEKPVGVEVSASAVDNYSLRNSPIFPATWYSSTYYTPIPTSDVAGDNPKDTSVVMFYNSLNRDISINWSNGVPANGSITLPAKSAVRFPLAYSTSAAYKFVNPTGESYTAIQIVDSYTQAGGGNSGSTYDWSINLISEARLTDYATIAWAPGSTDGSRNDNPVWVTPVANTTIYVKWDGDVLNGGSTSPCGLHYDVSYSLNALNYRKLLDPNDNSQDGMAVFTCNGVKIAAVYGEDPATALAANPSWDVGSTIQPFCKDKMIFANDDYAETLIGQPVTIPVLNNDIGYFAVIDVSSLNCLGLLQPAHGTISVNANGTILYTPDPGYSGMDYFEYQVCSTPSPVKCDIALVVIRIAACPSSSNTNIIKGQVFQDKTKDGLNNDDGSGVYPAKVYLYVDGNCNTVINPNELIDSVSVDPSGYYQFIKYPEKTVSENFDLAGGGNSCASGSDGNTSWLTNWVDAGEGGSTGYCVSPAQSNNNTDAEIVLDGGFSYALRLDDNNVSATRTLNLGGASSIYFSFSYRRGAATLTSLESMTVQLSTDGTNFTTIYTISGTGGTDAAYTNVYNIDISSYAGATTYLRFLTGNTVDEGDYVYFDNISIRYLKYNQCYITKLDPVSVQAGYYLTTTAEYAVTYTGGGSCEAQKDIGIAKNPVVVSGTVYNDANGTTDATINGTGTGVPGGSQLYAYLIDATGTIAFKSTVNSGNGSFSFPMADQNTNYTLKISTSNEALFSNPQVDANLPSNWISIGEDYGTNNNAGTNIEGGSPDCGIPVHTGILNITNIKIGLERLPSSDNKITAITHPSLNQYITLNGGMNPPVLSGSDPEDCPGGCLMTSKNVLIDAYPTNAELYYNNVLVYDGQLITNFNSSLLQVKITTATIGDTLVRFLYSYVDLAGRQDPTPATYDLTWPWPLPATGMVLSAKLHESKALLSWFTLTEQHSKHFILERSVDNNTWEIAATNIPAAGESVWRLDYSYQDPIENLLQYPVIYYRIKLVDLDERVSYSNIALVKPELTFASEIRPNPFSSFVEIKFICKTTSPVQVRLTDPSGRIIKVFKKTLQKGSETIVIDHLERLTPSMYLLEIKDENTQLKQITKLVKLH